MTENKPGTGNTLWAFALLPALVTFLLFLPVLRYDFLAWDDLPYIYDNPHIRSLGLSSFHWMCTTFHTGNWIPLTWLSLALDYRAGGLHPWFFHFTNLILHVANTTLVFFVCRDILILANRQSESTLGMSKPVPVISASILASFIFGFHPIHVESVAWISERKGLLCAFFFLACLLLYLNNASSSKPRIWKQIACFCLFVLSLLCKPIAVTLPLVLILLDAWPLRRLHPPYTRVLWSKAPYLTASLAVGIITILAQSGEGAFLTSEAAPLSLRVLNAFHSFAFYLWKMLVPLDLSPLYPLASSGQTAFSIPTLMGVGVTVLSAYLCFLYRKSRPFLAATWLFYFVTLSPVLGFLQVGYQAAADRYTYLPSIACCLLAAAFTARLLSAKPLLLSLFTISLVAGLGYGSMKQQVVWKDSISLWEEVVRIYPNISPVPHANLARSYAIAGRWKDSWGEFELAATLGPENPQTHQEKGIVLFNLGRLDDAVQEFKTAVVLDPGNTTLVSRFNLWSAYEKKGMHEEALSEIREVLKLDPQSAEARSDLDISLKESKLRNRKNFPVRP